MAAAEWDYTSGKVEAGGASGCGPFVVVGLVGGASFLVPALFPVVFLAVIVLAVWTWTRREKLILSDRYLIAGDQIVYFANVRSAVWEERRLLLSHLDGKLFVLEADRFVARSRKAPKIARFRAEKFAKVADRVVKRVRALAPDARITHAGGA